MGSGGDGGGYASRGGSAPTRRALHSRAIRMVATEVQGVIEVVVRTAGGMRSDHGQDPCCRHVGGLGSRLRRNNDDGS